MDMNLINEIAAAGARAPVTVVDFGDVVTALHVNAKQEQADEIHGKLLELMGSLGAVTKKAVELGLEQTGWDWLCSNVRALAERHPGDEAVQKLATTHEKLTQLCKESRFDAQLGGMVLNATATTVDQAAAAR